MGNLHDLALPTRRVLLIDLHTHTYPASDDSFVGADDLVDEAKRAGLDGICLTDHDYFWDPQDIRSLGQRHDFLVLPGSEITTEEGHVLVFGLDRYVFGMHKAPFLHRLATQQGAVMAAAHPYRRRQLVALAHRPEELAHAIDQTCQETLFSFCHAIEVVNGRGSRLENDFSHAICERLGLGGVAGSDSHRPEHLGTACTRFHHRISSIEDLVQELKAGRYEPVDHHRL